MLHFAIRFQGFFVLIHNLNVMSLIILQWLLVLFLHPSLSDQLLGPITCRKTFIPNNPPFLWITECRLDLMGCCFVGFGPDCLDYRLSMISYQSCELDLLVSNLYLSDEDDKWECLLDGSRVFSVKGVRKLTGSISINESRTRWNNLVPTKVNIASWRIKNQRIPTRVNLDYRGIDLHLIHCLVCDDDLETEEHILVKCVVAKNIWAEILKWWNINHICIDNLNEVFISASRANLPPNLTVVFDVIIQSTLWILWRFRNNSTFVAKCPSKSLILNDVNQFSSDWISDRIKKAKIN
nr:reverse transcriptase domain, reverse transcriptase zinc-binding domain protein [Tanacetum cinerariifolium]